MARILVQEAVFGMAAETPALTAGRTEIGGVASFLGLRCGGFAPAWMVVEAS